MVFFCKPDRIYRQKKIKVEKICELIKPGYRIFLSSGPVTPVYSLQHILNSHHPNCSDLEFIQLALLGNVYEQNRGSSTTFRIKTFTVGENIKHAFEEGKVDLIPSTTVGLPHLFTTDVIGVDIAIVQVSPPDRRGYLNLGLVTDVTELALQKASTVIAEVNPNVPIACGKTRLHISQVDYLVESSWPLLEYQVKDYDRVMDTIGWNVKQLINNNSTVSLSTGRMYHAIAEHLKEKENLKVISHVVSDWVIELIEAGAIKPRKIGRWKSPVRASSYIGSNRLYRYLHRNPYLKVEPLLYSRRQIEIQNIRQLCSVMNVKKIDASGDSVAIYSADLQVAGFDAKLNFAEAATHSREGKSIVVLPSLDQQGSSNIVIQHNRNKEHVRSTLGTTSYVVTEYGIANIFGKSIRERTLALIEIAHPRHRRPLFEEAKKQGYLQPEQINIPENTINYPHELETEQIFKNYLKVFFRPIKPSDEDMMRRLLYQFTEEARYRRFFSPFRVITHRKMQPYVNIDYHYTLSIVGVVQKRGMEKIIAEARYAYDEDMDHYEMAFVVDQEYHGLGIASFLREYLISTALNRNINKLAAFVLPENQPMIAVLEKASIRPVVHKRTGEWEFHFNLEEELFDSLPENMFKKPIF